MSDSGAADTGSYRVLARKYRPRSFDDLIGQEPMVRTLTNAFETGRIAQAWMLTGVRGVGKTTTARILARALNYETDAIKQPTIHMTTPGIHDQAIMEGRHVDVVEMDAASHTGIDDIREIIAQVRYKPLSARYKVTIIDEVHMLSTQAFNGLLKTLEEPPEHAKFVFATTEIRKVPVTVLSRCQRFDLRRVEAGTLIAHLKSIAEKESVPAEDEALRLIARAAEGSVRDALSLTDQAIAHGAGRIEAQPVRDMLGLADRARVIDLFEEVMAGRAPRALTMLRDQYNGGADPIVVLADLADFTHLVTTLRFVPEAATDASLSPAEAERGLAFARTLSIRALSQVWQMLLKAIEEARGAASPRQAAEMALIRIAYAADLPGPEELLRRYRSGESDAFADLPAASGSQPSPRLPGDAPPRPPLNAAAGAGAPLPAMAAPPSPGPRPALQASAAAPQAQGMAPQPRLGETRPRLAAIGGGAQPQGAPRPAPQPEPEADAEDIASLADLARLAETRRDSFMRVAIRRWLRPVSIGPGRLSIALADGAPATLPGDLQRRLRDWTGRHWMVSVSAGDAPTLFEIEEAEKAARLAKAAEDPEVAAILAAFPGAVIRDVRERAPASPPETVADIADIVAEAEAETDAEAEGDGEADVSLHGRGDVLAPVEESDDEFGPDWEPDPYGER